MFNTLFEILIDHTSVFTIDGVQKDKNWVRGQTANAAPLEKQRKCW